MKNKNLWIVRLDTRKFGIFGTFLDCPAHLFTRKKKEASKFLSKDEAIKEVNKHCINQCEIIKFNPKDIK